MKIKRILLIVLAAAALLLSQNPPVREVQCTDAGANDTYTCTASPTLASYTTGLRVRLFANTANTGSATVNIDSLGAKTIKKLEGGALVDLATGDIGAGRYVLLVYDGTYMQALSQLGASGGSGGHTVKGGGAYQESANTTSLTARTNLQFRQGIAASDNGSDTTIIDLDNADARVIRFDEEWLSASVTTNTYWASIGVTGSGGTSSVGTLFTGHTFPNLGIARVRAGSTSPSAGTAVCYGTVTNGGDYPLGNLGGNAGWKMVWVFALEQTTSIRLRIGTIGASASTCHGAINPSNSIGLRFDTASGFADTNFMFYVKDSGGSTVTADTGVAADTAYHTFTMYSAVAGTVRMSFDGGAEKTFCPSGCDGTVTLPTSATLFSVQLGTDTSAERDVRLDYFGLRYVVSTSTSNKRQ